jgi:hypothetical protein
MAISCEGLGPPWSSENIIECGAGISRKVNCGGDCIVLVPCGTEAQNTEYTFGDKALISKSFKWIDYDMQIGVAYVGLTKRLHSWEIQRRLSILSTRN